MATLNAGEQAALRELARQAGINVTFTKPQASAALQAIEDWFETNRTSLGAAIETAVPTVFTAAQKLALVKAWLLSKFNRGG